jgi:hypothetical protein
VGGQQVSKIFLWSTPTSMVNTQLDKLQLTRKVSEAKARGDDSMRKGNKQNWCQGSQQGGPTILITCLITRGVIQRIDISPPTSYHK